jgi:hypothetical protein
MNSTEAPLTIRQGVVIASRALCVMLLLNAVLSSTYLPGMIANLLHAWRTMPDLATGMQENYAFGIYIRDMALTIIRLATQLFVSWWLYRCGPGVAKFLSADSNNADEGNSGEDEPLETQG